MPSFKPKPHKKFHYADKKPVTLDSKHDERHECFQRNVEIEIPRLTNEKAEWRKKFKSAGCLEEKPDIKDRNNTRKAKIYSLAAQKK